ncbi:hypothetical protein SARC_05349, partial [Sphaeroforma arctica JP610]
MVSVAWSRVVAETAHTTAADTTDIADTHESTNIDVLLTGFGAFQGHTVNASWEAVGELDKMVMAV